MRSGLGPTLAARLAHRGSVLPPPAMANPESIAAGVDGPPRVEARGVGYVREAIELPVTRRAGRPAALGGDLDAIDLPTAPALARALSTLARLPTGGLDPRRPAVMLDLETTGLLGQAGAVVCVVAVAFHVEIDRVRVEQWSLHRLGAEGVMLADLDAALREHLGGPVAKPSRAALVTFNGSSFDLPLLRRRLVRHGIYGPTEEPLRAPHVDLLPPARRLWRDRGPDCRLGTLELRHLRMPREGDVSGAEVVELLWRWLQAPDSTAADDLARVQRHNRIDVLSLAALAEAMHARLLDPHDAVERLRAARHHDRLTA